MKFESIINRASFKESQALNKNIKTPKLLESFSKIKMVVTCTTQGITQKLGYKN